MNINIREWKKGEQALLEDFLYEAIFIPEDFISAVMVFQEEHGMGTPSVTNNSFGRAYGKMLHDSATGKYYVFIDSSVASMIMDDQVFDSFFSRGDEKSYFAAKREMTAENREQLRHLLTFSAKKHSRYNLTNDQLDKLNKQIRKRAQILLND